MVGTLSDAIGDYTLPPLTEFVAVADDRLLYAGHPTDSELNSRVWWTPTSAAPGVGNQERIELSQNPWLDLDANDGGGITGVSGEISGTPHVFKRKGIYRLSRTGIRSRAFSAFTLTKERGAIRGSVVNALDETGRPITFFIDPSVGPCTIGARGVMEAGYDILPLLRPYLDAPTLTIRSVHYANKRQLHWWLQADGLEPIRIVLHLNEIRGTDKGLQRGWTVFTGAAVEDATIDPQTGHPLTAHTAADGLLLRHDIAAAVDDAGTPFHAEAVSAPWLPKGISGEGGLRRGMVYGSASGAQMEVSIVGDLGDSSLTRVTAFTAPGGASHVTRDLDSLQMVELQVVQIRFADPAEQTARWTLDGFVGTPIAGQSA